MTRIRYCYNTKTCNYEPVSISNWGLFLRLLRFIIAASSVAIGIFWVYTTYFESPKETQLRQENALLRRHYDQVQQELDKSNQVLAHLQDQDDQLYRMILELEPVPSSVREAGVGGTYRYQELADKPDIIRSTFQRVDQLKRQLYIQSKSYDELAKLAKEKEKMLACIPSIQPISNKELKRLSSPFGMRLHPVYKIFKMHHGVDFAAPRGTPIYATGDGVVKLVQNNALGYGKEILVEHGYGFVTRYCHLQEFKVKSGQKIKRGQCIGYVGSTGVSTSPHLHYEVIKNRKNVDPVHYFGSDLNAEQYEMILELASRKIQPSS